MNVSLKNLKALAISLNIMPFHEVKHSKKKGTIVHFKPKTKQELIKNINSIDPKKRKKLLTVSFANKTINNSGNSKTLVTASRQRRCPRTGSSHKPESKCNDIQIKKDCKFSKKGNQPKYSKTCVDHFPCHHKKGFAELQNANNFKHYLQSQNINYKYSPTSKTRRESRQNYGYVPAKNIILLRSHKHKTNLALWKKNNTTEKGKLIILNNGNLLHVRRNANGILKVIKK